MTKTYDEGHCRWHGWAEETENDNEDDREGVYYLTITDERGEEVAVIMHRILNGKYPLDGEVAQRKVHNAQVIVDALNANRDGHTFAGDLR